jgi:hypothetical protein
VNDPSIRSGDAEDLFGAECADVEGNRFGGAADVNVWNNSI